MEKTTGSTVQRLAARSLIRDLEEGTSHLHNQTIRPKDSDVKQEIVNLGVKYSLVSKHTSFIAIEDRSAERSDWFFAPPPSQPVSRPVATNAPAPVMRSRLSSGPGAAKLKKSGGSGGKGGDGGGGGIFLQKSSAPSKRMGMQKLY